MHRDVSASLSVLAFKKRFNLSQAQLNDLVKRKVVELQQNGYRGHSLMHHKNVVFEKKRVLMATTPRRTLRFEYRYRCVGGFVACGLPFKTKADVKIHQKQTHHWGREPFYY